MPSFRTKPNCINKHQRKNKAGQASATERLTPPNDKAVLSVYRRNAPFPHARQCYGDIAAKALNLLYIFILAFSKKRSL